MDVLILTILFEIKSKSNEKNITSVFFEKYSSYEKRNLAVASGITVKAIQTLQVAGKSNGQAFHNITKVQSSPCEALGDERA